MQKTPNKQLIFIPMLLIICFGCAISRYSDKDDKLADASHFYHKGNKELSMDNPHKAIEIYSKGLSKNPKFVNLYISRAIAYFMIGELYNSQHDLLYALKLQPDNFDANKWLGKIYYYQGDIRQAYSYFKKIGTSNLKSRDDLYWYNLIRESFFKLHMDAANLALENHDFESAKKEFESCRLIKPEDSEPICRLCELYLIREEPWNSLKLLKSLDVLESPCLIKNRSLTNFNLANFTKAYSDLKLMKEKYPDNQALRELQKQLNSKSNLQLYEKFNAIKNSEFTTREDIAFLIAIRILPFVDLTSTKKVIVTDIDDNPFRKYISIVILKGLMDVYPNHTFNPSVHVKRHDFAMIIDNLIRNVSLDTEKYSNKQTNMGFSDLSPDSNYYDSALNILKIGLLKPFDDGTFRGSADVKGNDTIYCFEKITEFLLQKL
jgi:tetratricopeptide (TPR) repeat protein